MHKLQKKHSDRAQQSSVWRKQSLLGRNAKRARNKFLTPQLLSSLIKKKSGINPYLYITYKGRLKRGKYKLVLKRLVQAYVYIRSTLNNLFLTAVTRVKKNVITTSSTGYAGFKGSNRTTQFAAEQTGRLFGKNLRYKKRVQFVIVKVVSPMVRQVRSSLRGIKFSGLTVVRILARIKRPHNGMRKRKTRRV